MSTEERLADALGDSADRLNVAGPSMDDVVGRARVIRRHRRMASGIAAAAVVAALAPVAVLAMNDSGDADSSPPVATQGPSGTAAVDPSVPGVAYYDSRTMTVHRPDGSSVSVDMRVQVFSFAALADGRMLFIGGQDYRGTAPVADVFVLAADGSSFAKYPSWGFELTTTADGTTAAWIGEGGTPMVLESGVDAPVLLDPMSEIADTRIEPVQVRGDCGGDAGCVVYGFDAEDSQTLWESSTVFPAQRYAGDSALAVAPDGRYFLATISRNDDEHCVGLWDRNQIGGEAQPEPLGDQCFPGMLGADYEFSPNGRWIVAQHGEGYGPGKTEILDGRTLEVVTEASETGATYHDAAWEDADTLLMVVDYNQQGMDKGRYELQRLHLDGTLEKLGLAADHLQSR